MKLQRLPIIGVGIIIAATLLLIGNGWYVALAQPPAPVPATAEQVNAFEGLIQRERRVVFDAANSGDVSLFPTVYYNDATVALDPGYVALLTKHRLAVDAALARTQPGPRGAATGFLSYETAYLIAMREQPGMRTGAKTWQDQQIYIREASLQGDHAAVSYTFQPTRATFCYHVYFTRVNGQWYISNRWNTGRP